jgi:type II secretory pathway predicted ATPase ExeA
MRLSRLLRPGHYGSAVARLIAAVFTEDGFIMVLGQEPARLQVLDRAVSELASLRCRVVRVAANEPHQLSLHDFVQQLSGQLGSHAGPGDTLERTHRYLTEADASCECIALLIDNAHLLQASALRFIQLTCRSGPNLRVVLASNGEAAANLCTPEFSLLHARSSTCISV